MARRDPREGEGAIFDARSKTRPLTRENAAAYCEAVQAEFARRGEPLDMLRELERVPLEILRDIERETDESTPATMLNDGEGGWHKIRLPAEMPAIGHDALRELSALLMLKMELKREQPRVGWIVAEAVQVGFRIAAMRARAFEPSVHKWNKNQEPLIKRQQGKPITEQARKLLAEGASIRDVQRMCSIGYQVARRWRKEFLENG